MSLEIIGKQIDQLIERTEGSWSVVIEDLQTGENWHQNAEELHYAASIIKLPIMATVYRLADEGQLRMSEQISIAQEDLVGGAGVLQHLHLPALSIQDLVMLMIIQSDNTATNLLIDRVTVAEVQETMRQLGMTKSTFYNRLMTVPAVVEGYNKITAADIARCLKKISQGTFSSLYACEQMIDIMKKQQVHYMTEGFPPASGQVVGELPAWTFASKTGNVTGVRHDVGLLYVGRRALSVTLLSSECDKNAAHETLGEIGLLLYTYLKAQE